MKRGKRYVEAAKAIDRATLYDTADAIALVKKAAVAKFDETIEAHLRTGCDGRHADQQIRGAVVLPHGTGKTVRILVFAKGPKADEALAAGADFVGAEELIPEDPERGLVRFRRCCRYTGYDGRCWTSWPCTWTQGLNAEPQGRNCNHGRYKGHQRDQSW